ncbi:MAG: PTS transporter subunit EIIC [Solobacterium sp.]|nr:PTS transporter subunit EIIC [Solobacterium sp.]
MKILVVCAAGMTSSALVANMRAYVKDHPELDYKIGSCASNQTDLYVPQADVIFIAPQLVYEEESLRRRFPDRRIILIPAGMYGELDGGGVLDLLNEKASAKQKEIPGWALRLSSAIAHSAVLQSLSSAMMSLFPVLMTGSILTLMRNFPNQMYLDALEAGKVSELLDLGIAMTTGCISLYMVFLTAYRYAKTKNLNPAGAGVNAMICFLLLLHERSGVIMTQYIGASGMFFAFLTSFLSVHCYGRFYHTMVKYAPEIDQLPDNILGSFLSILPVFYSITVFLAIDYAVSLAGSGTVPELVYVHIQNRLQKYIGDSIISGVLIIFLIHFFWFLGIHGGQIMNTVSTPVLMPLSQENLAAYQAGLPLPHIMNYQFRSIVVLGGAGSTLALCILMAFAARSQKMKRLGRLALPMGVFGINEPLLFGIPLVLNPFMLAPFALIPALSMLATYFMTVQGILPRLNGLEIPWTTPALISGMIEGGWRMAVWQGIMLAVQALIWYPFFRILDNRFLSEEKNR